MLVQVFGAIFRRWRERRQRGAAIRDLRAVDDRTLKDMGLTRGEIVAAVDGQVYRGKQPRPDKHTPPSSPAPASARLEAIDAAALQGHLGRARRLRAELMVALIRPGFGGIVRMLQGAASLSPPSRRKCWPACRRHAPRALRERAR